MARRKKSIQVYQCPTTQEEIGAYRRDDSKIRIVAGGFFVNRRPVSGRKFLRTLKVMAILAVALLICIAIWNLFSA